MSKNKGSAGVLPPVVQGILSCAFGLFSMYGGYRIYVELSHFNEHGGEITMPRFMFVINDITGALGPAVICFLVGLYLLWHGVKLVTRSKEKTEENDPQ